MMAGRHAPSSRCTGANSIKISRRNPARPLPRSSPVGARWPLRLVGTGTSLQFRCGSGGFQRRQPGKFLLSDLNPRLNSEILCEGH